MKRKIAAILAADVVGYSRLVAENEEDALARLIAYREIFSDFMSRYGGRIFNTAGDAVLAEYGSSVEALRSALDIQESIRTRNAGLPEHRRMRFRIGMTVGDVIEREGDLLGDAVNVAARLEGLAAPGGICVSRTFYEQVANKVEISFRDIGLQHVKNIPNPVHAFAVLNPEASTQTGTWGLRRPVVQVLAATVVVLIGVFGAWTFNLRSRTATADTSRAGVAIGTDARLVYAPVYEAASPGLSATFDPLRTPFVCDACRDDIKARIALGSNSAVAVSASGNYGVASQRDTPDRAVQDALGACNGKDGRACKLFEVNGTVVLPGSVPMPPEPWVSPSMKRSPFDAGKIANLSARGREQLGDHYRLAPGPKSVALGPRGAWGTRLAAASLQEAVRASLESCGWHSQAPCRIIAVDNEFVVEPSEGPVDLFRQPNLLAAEPRSGALGTGQVVLIDDGTCPLDQVKELTGGNQSGEARKRRCIARP